MSGAACPRWETEAEKWLRVLVGAGVGPGNIRFLFKIVGHPVDGLRERGRALLGDRLRVPCAPRAGAGGRCPRGQCAAAGGPVDAALRLLGGRVRADARADGGFRLRACAACDVSLAPVWRPASAGDVVAAANAQLAAWDLAEIPYPGIGPGGGRSPGGVPRETDQGGRSPGGDGRISDGDCHHE